MQRKYDYRMLETRLTISRCLFACVLAGLSLALVAPSLWLAVLLISSESFRGGLDVRGILSVFVGVIPFATLIGVAAAILLGAPVLLALHWYAKHVVLFASIAGAAIVLFALIAFGASSVWQSLPVTAYFALLGAWTGGFAAWLTRPANCSSQAGARTGTQTNRKL